MNNAQKIFLLSSIFNSVIYGTLLYRKFAYIKLNLRGIETVGQFNYFGDWQQIITFALTITSLIAIYVFRD